MLVCVLVEGILVYKLFHECCDAICLRVIVCHDAASLGEVRILSCMVVRSTKPREFAFAFVKCIPSIGGRQGSRVFLSHAPPVLLRGGSDTPSCLHRSPAHCLASCLLHFTRVAWRLSTVLRPFSAHLLLKSKVRSVNI